MAQSLNFWRREVGLHPKCMAWHICGFLPLHLLNKERSGRLCTFCSSSAKSKAVQTLGKVGHQELKRVALQICNQFLRHETACVLNHISTINHLFLESISGSISTSITSIHQSHVSINFWFRIFGCQHYPEPRTQILALPALWTSSCMRC